MIRSHEVCGSEAEMGCRLGSGALMNATGDSEDLLNSPHSACRGVVEGQTDLVETLLEQVNVAVSV